jgi:glycosyltransferase involved in cell wall biosynthesis
MRVCLFAYVCDPDGTSESAVGWEMVVAASSTAHVTIMTCARGAPTLEDRVAELQSTARVVRVRMGVFDRFGDSGLALRVHSMLWQCRAVFVARSLHKRDAFDVSHHVTFATDWAPFAANYVGTPCVWGPVGGYVRQDLRVMKYLGFAGAARHALKRMVSAPIRRLVVRHMTSRVRVVVAQNSEVASKLHSLGLDAQVRPNVSLNLSRRDASEARSNIVGYAGHLYRFKGIALLIDAMARPQLEDWILEIAGDGPAARWLARRAAHRGVQDRIRFIGRLSRHELFSWMRTLSVFAFPSLGDSAGWSLAEAGAIGVPIVCIDRGGPPDVVGKRAAVPLHPVATLVERLAHSISQGGTEASQRWSRDRLRHDVSSWYELAGRPRRLPGMLQNLQPQDRP